MNRKVFWFVLFFVLLFCSSMSMGQSTTVIGNVDSYDWNRLIVNHSLDKDNGLSFQIWYKQKTDTERIRLGYQRKFAFAKKKNGWQFTTGIAFQGTSRKRRSVSYQFVLPNELQYKFKVNEKVTLNLRNLSALTISPNAKQGDHAFKNIMDVGVKYKKVNVFYRGEQLVFFKTSLRENFQGVGITYDFHKRLTLGGIPYRDLKSKSSHFSVIATYRF